MTVVEQGGRARQVRGLGAWLARSAPKSAQGEVTVVLVSDAKMRALNRRFRGKDTVTDVLSFPAEQGPEKGVRHLFRLNAQKKVPYSFFVTLVSLPLSVTQKLDDHR